MILSEQVLEQLSAHVASNDRVVAAAERIESSLKLEAEKILAEHRRAIATVPAPRGSPPPCGALAATERLTGIIHRWGMAITLIALILVLIGVALLVR
jgi:hypothetical protein